MPKYATKPKPTPEGAVELNNRNASKDEFAKRIYAHLQAKGWTQSQLARYAGLNRDAVNTYVRGRSLPSPESPNKMAKIFGVRPEELLPNYYEAAVEEAASRFEAKEVHGEPGYMWLKVNMRVPKDVGVKIFMMLNAVPDDEANQ